MWATQFSLRLLFEWVWDGTVVRIVQADTADSVDGVDPLSLLPKELPSVENVSLSVFRLANDNDFSRYRKLSNARLYGDLGYTMPTFYVLDNPIMLRAIASGEIPSELLDDLDRLTTRPLIIRTDGVNVPFEKREMLPRSEGLRSRSDATDWLLTRFKPEIDQSELADSGLCLIAHHFIPSIASAWARAEPSTRIVRIESLWGIPEGLYWYSHDTFEVDTQTVEWENPELSSRLKYTIEERLRYKGTFIAPDNNGQWIAHQTRSPFDWRKSIGNPDWLFEIAHTTRRIAEREGRSVSVMWFINNHPQATIHPILPWFHSESKYLERAKAAPRKKYANSSDYYIRKQEDWNEFQQKLASGARIERVVVEPRDAGLIRNHQFVCDLAALAKSKKLVIELYGGLLSHAYHILQREGALVECVDLFGADEDTIDYNKVVRDDVPAFIQSRGEYVEIVKLEGEALVAALRRKLVEEAFEVLDAKAGQELLGELADVQEVLVALCNALRTPITEVEEIRANKKRRRGGFDKGLMLIKTTTPHSIQRRNAALDMSSLDMTGFPERVITAESDIPIKAPYRRPDLRQVDQLPEKLITFETEIDKIGNKMDDVVETLEFALASENSRKQNLSLTIALGRKTCILRVTARLRVKTKRDARNPQLEFDFGGSD